MCVICGRVARDENELEQHMLTHSMEKPYQCVKCDKTFKNLRNQQSHQFLFHNISDGLTPNRMQGLLMTSKKRKSKTFSECYDDEPLDVTMPDVKKKRIDSNFNNQSFDCRSPAAEDYKTKSIGEANTEKLATVMNSINTTAFPCTSCHKTFATEVDLKAHLMRHLTQHPFVCLACGKGFKYEHSLNFHIKSYHNSSGNISNNNNNNTSSSKNNMENETKQSDSHKLSDIEKKHEKSNKVQSENLSEADYDEETSIDEETEEDNDEDNDENHNKSICFDYGAPANFAARSIQIKSEKILITLLEGIHPVTEQTYILYKCCLCGFAFPSLEPVILHMQTSHLNTNKEFTCDKCGANFKWRSELSLHEQLHKAMDHHDNSAKLSIPSFMQPNLVLMSTDFGSNLSPSHSINNNNNDNINNNNNNNNCLTEGINFCDEKISQNKYKSHKTITHTKATKQKSEPQHSSEIKLKTEDLQSQVSIAQKFPIAIGDIEETAPGQFKCRFCDKTFDRIFSVHRHERVHTGFKPCICKTCGRGFSEKRNLRHHIIRFHSDGSGRELLKRNRKDKSNGTTSNKRKIATSLKKAALKILNNGIETTEKNSGDDNNCDKKSIESKLSSNGNNEQMSSKISSNSVEASIECGNSTKATTNNSSSSSTRRRKGKPSKKIIATEEFSPVSSSLSTEENIENHDNDKTENTDKSPEETDANSGSEINPNDFLETKFRCHGAFFSSYNPRYYFYSF
jgi:KRAB domain-containing zinc finger protein